MLYSAYVTYNAGVHHKAISIMQNLTVPSSGSIPAPWTLRGQGWVMPQLQRVDEVAVYVPKGLQIVGWRGWTPGGYLFADYTSSPVGPYREILFIPALVRLDRKIGFHVSHIYVDSVASVIGGQNNWWLPKDRMQFALQPQEHTIIFQAYRNATAVVTGVLTDTGALSIPFNNRRWPLALLQARAGRFRCSHFWARGRIGVANGVLDICDRVSLPRPTRITRLPLLSISHFELVFEQGATITTEHS